MIVSSFQSPLVYNLNNSYNLGSRVKLQFDVLLLAGGLEFYIFRTIHCGPELQLCDFKKIIYFLI